MTEGVTQKEVPRFRGSEFVQIEVEIYTTTFSKELSTDHTGEVIHISSEETHGGAIALVGFNYSHQINTVAPGCVLRIKAKGTKGTALLDAVQPNYWVDVTVQRHRKKFHVFRGRIAGSSIHTQAPSIGGGATEHTLELSCRGFGFILQQTQVYYDIVNEGTDLPLAYPRILINADNNQSVEDTTRSLLKGFLAEGEDGSGRSMWELPEALPGVAKGDLGKVTSVEGIEFEERIPETKEASLEPPYLKDALHFFPADEERAIENYPERVNSQSLSWLSPARGGESLWGILQRWNDGPTTDMYTDLVGADGKYLMEGQETTPKDTRMSFILRDKPFPTTTRVASDTGPLSKLFTDNNGASLYIDTEGYWFNEKTEANPDGYLPVFNVDWKDIASRSVTRSDLARKNAFFVAPVLTQGLTGLLLDIQAPLWDVEDIQQNGLRPVFYSSAYLLDITKVAKLAKKDADKSIVTQISVYRRRIRDFMCLGHLFMSGSVTLGHGRPDIRVGGKLKINTAGDQSPEKFEGSNLGGVFQETYHIEGVSHVWSPVQGMRTDLMVTRGIRGDDTTRIQLLRKKLEKFTLATAEKS